MYNLWFAQQYQRRFYVTAECSHVATAKNIIDTFDGRESEGYYVVDIGITIDNEKGYNRNRDGIQTGNPHPYPNYPTMGIPLAAFIQYYREL